MSHRNRFVLLIIVVLAGVAAVAWAQGGDAATETSSLKESMSFVEVFKAGGVLMYPITAMSLIGVALIVYFLIVMRAEQVVPSRRFEQVREKLAARHWDEVRMLCERKPSPISAVIVAAIDYIGETAAPDPSLLKEIMQGEGIRQATRLQNQAQYLLDIAVITPMIGLLGTVVGMLQAFNSVALDIAKAKPMVLAAGVSLALITTAAGLIVAIPAMAAYAYFRNRVAGLTARLETASADLLTLIVK